MLHKSIDVPSEAHKILNGSTWKMKTPQGQQMFSATLLKMLEVVEAGLRDIDRPPKLSLADYR
jgi:hypothetical protein